MAFTRRNWLAGTLGAITLGPLHAESNAAAGVADETWIDRRRSRELPVKLRWPDPSLHPGERPIVLFSHGLGGTREGGAVWGAAWAQAGLVVLHLQHPGSDLAALRGTAGAFTNRAGLRSAASPAQLVARLGDVAFALDEIGRRHTARLERWAMVRPSAIGMSGHSFGAHTTLGMAGQRYPGFAGINEPRLASFIAFSPTVPMVDDAQRAFERITRPLLSITGSRDQDVAGTGATPDKRMAVFAALPKGSKSHLVLQDADHMTFAGQTGRAVEIVPREAVTRDRQDAHHALVAAITTDWWRATLQGDAAARERLAAPRGLGAGDLWQSS